VTRKTTEKWGEAEGKEREVRELDVLRVLAGACGPRVRLVPRGLTERLPAYATGRLYYVCLHSPWAGEEGTYCDGAGSFLRLSRVPFEVQGERVTVDEGAVPPEIARHLDPPTPAAFEAVVRWLRGPRLAAAPAQRPLPCDKPFAFDVTFTHPSTFPMRLRLPLPGQPGFLHVGNVMDGDGRSLLLCHETGARRRSGEARGRRGSSQEHLSGKGNERSGSSLGRRIRRACRSPLPGSTS